MGKYLVALSSSLTSGNAAPDGRRESSPKRRCLHILYLLNDVLHHTKYHMETNSAFATLSGSLQPFIVDLLGAAASFDREKNPKHYRRLDDLMSIWETHGYYAADYVGKLREVVKNAALATAVKAAVGSAGEDAGSVEKTAALEAPFMMPPSHGDSSTPYYDLPAGNFLPHIVPNSPVPLRPESIKPLQFLTGPADKKLVAALKLFLEDVDRIYSSEEAPSCENGFVDIDDLGQTVIRDQTTGEIVDGETYYGWSRAFCAQMKKRNAKDSSRRSRSQTRSRSRSRSRRSRSSSPYKRRRYSDSSDSRRSSSRSRTRSLSRRPARRRRYESTSRSRSVSTRRSRLSREKSYSPRPPTPPPPPIPPKHQMPPAPLFYVPQTSLQIPSNNGSAQFNPLGMVPFPPPPPPPPPNYHGPWPPPPPPMPPANMTPSLNSFPYNAAFGPAGAPMPQQPLQQGLGHPPPPHGGPWHPPRLGSERGAHPPAAGRGWR